MRIESPPGASAETSANLVVGAGATADTSANIALWVQANFASVQTSTNIGSNFASADTSANLAGLFASAGTSANLVPLFASAGTSANLVPLFASAGTSASLAGQFASAGTSANLASAATSANVASWVNTNFASAGTSANIGSNFASAGTSANLGSWVTTNFASAGTSANIGSNFASVGTSANVVAVLASAGTSANLVAVLASSNTSANVLSIAATRFLSTSLIQAGTNVSVSVSAGIVTIHAAGGVGGGFSPTRVYVHAGEQTVSDTTPVTVSSLFFTLAAGNYYQFEFNLMMRTGTGSTGPRVTLTIPAVSAQQFAAYAIGPTAGDGAANEFRGEITAGSDAVVFTSVPGAISASIPYFFKVEGIIAPTANGNLACLFANETGTVPVRVLPGSNGILWNLTSA